MQFYQEEDIQKFDQVQFVYIKTELADHVFRLILNRPEKRNAFTPTMAQEITYALAYAHYTSEVRCVIVEAEGPVFCAGADLIAFHNQDVDKPNVSLPAIREEARLGDAFGQLLKPSIAIVKGPVLAGGFLLICGCTFVISVPEATFALPEVKRGIWPMQVMESLTAIIPARKILEMAVTGKAYTAGEANEMGLLTKVVESAQIQREADVLAAVICTNAPHAIQSGMKAFQKLSSVPVDERHRFLKEQLNLLLLSEDAKEGTAAFREKRDPVWKGK
jgi:methylglutaconyl-CoA hydratase